MKMRHSVCCNGFYPRTQDKVCRFHIPDSKVPWKKSYPEYAPIEYTSPSILKQPPYADLQINMPGFTPKWNSMDGKIDRRSYGGRYEIIENFPRNPAGRTGVRGRGALGRWGPNHAADPIVTRWKTMNGKKVMSDANTPILQFVAIQRKDNNEWAIPGGMVDPGEKITATLKREFMEEALDSTSLSQKDIAKLTDKIEEFFNKGIEIYTGYVDDPRNTDNAWMETSVFNFHDDQSDGPISKMQLVAGDDAKNVTWMDISSSLNLYANHKDFFKKVSNLRKSYW